MLSAAWRAVCPSPLLAKQSGARFLARFQRNVGGRPSPGPRIRPRVRPARPAGAEQPPGMASSITAESAPSVVSPLFDEITMTPAVLDKNIRQVSKSYHIAGSHRKMSKLARLVRGLPLSSAMDQLTFSHKGVARHFLTVLRSAKANAQERGMSVPDLHVSSIYVTRGPQSGMIDYKGRSRTGRILRRSGHLFVELSHKALPSKQEATKQLVDRIAKRLTKRLKVYRH